LGGADRRPIHLGLAWLGSAAGAKIGLSGTCRSWIGLAGRGEISDRRLGGIGRGGIGLGADLPRRHCGVHSRGHRRTDEWCLARHHTCPSGPNGGGRGRSSRALQASGGLGADALLHLGSTLGRAPCPLAQALDLARLGKGQQ
jgi:hypothetical protein